MAKRKFNLQRGINKLKSEAKKMPKRTAKQLPNAALTLAGGGAAGAAVKGLRTARKAIKAKRASKIPKSIKLKNNKRQKVTNRANAIQVPLRRRKARFRIKRYQ